MSKKDEAFPFKKKKRQYKPNGTRLGAKGVVARAMLDSGASLRQVREATGISQTTAVGLKRQDVANPAQLESVKKFLAHKFTEIAKAALDHINDEKLADAGAGELGRLAGLCSERAVNLTEDQDQRQPALQALFQQLNIHVASGHYQQGQPKGNEVSYRPNADENNE